MDSHPPGEVVRVARHAMATRFEIVLTGGDPVSLRAAGEEALEEIARMEDLFSAFRPYSDIGRVNAEGYRHPVRVAPVTFRVLQHALHWSDWSGGAFDITCGALTRFWRMVAESGGRVDPEALEAVRSATGPEVLELNPTAGTVGLRHPDARLDLGSLGKGWALDEAVAVLRDAGVHSALLHGGTSTVVALGRDAEGLPWRVALPGTAGTVSLSDSALSVSATWGRQFTDAEGRTWGHVIDPRSGFPLPDAAFAAVETPSATDSDAGSTAVLVAGEALLETLRSAGRIRWGCRGPGESAGSTAAR